MSGPVDVLAVLDSLIEYHDTSDSLKGRNCIAARAVVADLIEALAAIRDFRGELNTPVANSVKLRGIARAALANVGGAV
jgi:hypothetical protein